MKKALVLLVLALVLGCTPKREVIPVAAEFPNGSSVSFGTMPSAMANLSQRTITAWIKINGTSTNGHIVIDSFTGAQSDWFLAYYDTPTLNFVMEWTTTRGNWNGTANLTVGTWYHVALSYDKTSAANDPVFYLNGSSVGITEVIAPSGSAPNDSADTLYSGGVATYTNLSMLTIADLRVYNRILTATEIENIRNSKSFCDNDYGLVFHAPFLGVAGGVSDGGTMAAANTVIDRIGGVVGTPAGSPVFRADTILSCP